MKKTAVEYLFEELWDTPKNKFIWAHILDKAKNIEEYNLLRYGLKCFIIGFSSAIVGMLISKFI
jgi:hypothetical protein